MIKIVPDKEGKLTQWDLNRKIIVTGYDGVAEVHFASPGDDHGAYVVKLVDGEAEIPNILLTMAGTINVYVYPADRTVFATTLWVMAREKPDDYVYTETEVLNWRTLDEKIGDLAKLTTTARENLVAAINEAATLGMTAAKVGDYAKVAEVDENGVPTRFEAADIIDKNLTEAGKAADAAIVGDQLGNLSKAIAELGTVYIGKDKPTDGTMYWLDTSDTENEPETATYTVTKNLTNATIDNVAETVAEKSSYAATLTAVEGYALSSVTVIMGGVDITSTSYDAGNVYIASVTGDIVITAVAVETAETVLYTITNNLVNVNTSNTAISAEDGTSYTATLTVADGYDLDSVTVTMGGADVTADVYADGVITIEAVTGDVVITATAVKQSEYNTAVEVVAVNLTGLNLYEDDGETVIDSGIQSKRISSEAFDSDTEVEITLFMTSTSYGTMRVQSYDAVNDKLYRRESFPKSDQYFESGKSYTYIYTIKAGCKLSFTVSNNNYAMFDITVMRKG